MSETNGQEPKPQKRKRTRANDAVLVGRVEEVLTLRLNGAELYDIREYAREKKWPVSDRQLRRYMADADLELVKSLEGSREKLLGRHIAQRRSLYARALQDGDYRTALAVIRDEAELQGLYPKKQIEHEHSGAMEVKAEYVVSDAERVAALSRLYARLGAATGSTPTERNGSRN